jgi:hypothetical protein
MNLYLKPEFLGAKNESMPAVTGDDLQTGLLRLLAAL